MVHVGVYLTGQIEREDVRVATVVDKTCLVAVEHAVEAEREELVMVGLLNYLLAFITLRWVVQIKEVRETIVIVVCASHITLLLTDNLTQVFHEEGTCWNLFHGEESPHAYVLGALR